MADSSSRSDRGRRTAAAGVVVVSAALALGVAVLSAALALGAAAGAASGDGSRSYTGSSEKGDLAEALGDAVARASAEMPCCDRILEWRLKDVGGTSGGIRGMNRLNVTIEAQVK